MLTLLPGLILIGIGVYFLYPVLLSFMALFAIPKIIHTKISNAEKICNNNLFIYYNDRK